MKPARLSDSGPTQNQFSAYGFVRYAYANVKSGGEGSKGTDAPR